MYKYFFLNLIGLLLPATLVLGVTACHAKDLDIKATGSVTAAYDDNITYVSTNRLSDFVTNLEAGLVLMQQGKTHQLSLQTDVIEQIFASHSNFDNTSEDLKIDYKQDFSQYDHLELKDNLTHSYEPTSFEDAFGRTTGRYSTLTNQTGLSYTHDFTERLSTEMHYDDVLNYFSHNGPVDSSMFQGGGKINYSLDSANIFDVAYDYIRDLFKDGPSATINSLLAGARRYFTPQFYLDLGAGPDFIKTFSGKNNIEPHYTAALTDQVNENTKISLTFEKDDATNIYTEDLFNSWRAALNLNRRISQRLNGNMNIFYGQGRYDSLNVKEDFTGVQAQLNYAINPKTQLALGYSYSDSSSNSSGYGYIRNYVFFNATIKF